MRLSLSMDGEGQDPRDSKNREVMVERGVCSLFPTLRNRDTEETGRKTLG